MTFILNRNFYSEHREIHDWLYENFGITYGNGYTTMFGYQYIDLNPEQHLRFVVWLKPKKNKNGGYTGISIQSEPPKVS